MQNYPNSACMQNTFFVHAAILHVNIWRWGVLAQLVRKSYHIYMHSDPNSACTQNTFFIHAAILHVHIWPVSVSIIQRRGSGTASTKNIPHLHALGPQFCMYAKHFFRTCGNSACTQITFFVHAAILHVHIWRWGVLDHLARKTYHSYMHSDPNSACAHLAYTRELGLLCNKKKYQYLNKNVLVYTQD